MNPGPHGPEPCWLHVLQCPGGSRDARLNSNCSSLVSVRVPLEPPGAGNLCPGCAPARASKDGGHATTSHLEVALPGQAVTLFSRLTLSAVVSVTRTKSQYEAHSSVWRNACGGSLELRCRRADVRIRRRGHPGRGRPYSLMASSLRAARSSRSTRSSTRRVGRRSPRP